MSIKRLLLLSSTGLVVAISLTTNVFQYAYIRREPLRHPEDGTSSTLAEEAAMKPLVAKSLTGEQSRIDAADAPGYTVLYIVRPKCIWCLRNEGSIGALVRQAGPAYRFVGVALSTYREAAAHYTGRHALPFSVIADLDERSRKSYHLGGTPQMIVLDHKGKVVRVWSGAFTGSTKAAVESFFHLSLPDLDWTATAANN
jgi:hypothetical protein